MRRGLFWVWHPFDALSPYQEVYSFGQGTGIA